MSQDGYILTNNHVVEDADQIKVKLANGKEYQGEIVGRDPKPIWLSSRLKESQICTPSSWAIQMT